MPATAELSKPPAIEHITQNYFSLKSIILSVTERCGKELANVLRTTESLPSDTARKEQFLNFVVACRQEYVKLYVLCKWAVVSGEISRSIDVANWIHGQINCFNNVVAALYNLQAALGPAKSPWADLETALEVLNLGQPFPSPEVEMFLPKEPLSDVEVLRLLKRLDVLIALRLALHEQIPVHYRNYEVHNGRARFHLGSSTLWVEFSIADEVVEKASRFFYVDCGLEDENIEIDANLRLKIETAVNQQLTSKGLVEVLDWLSYVAAIYKLQLLDRQLSQTEQGAGPWAKVVSHRFSSTFLQIRYFLDASDPGEIKISISEEAPYYLLVDPHMEVDLNGSTDGLANRVLSEATRTHAIRLMSTITAPFITSKSEFSVSLELSPYKFTDLSIDSTSGKFALAGQDPLINIAQRKLNDGHDPVAVLSELRTQTFMETMATRAEASGWQARRNIKLSPDELAKIAPYTTLLALKLPASNSWSLCIALGAPPVRNAAGNAKLSEPRWFVCRLSSVQGRWTIQSINDIHAQLNLADPDYGVFSKLVDGYHRHFALLEVMRELESGNVRFGIKQRDGTNVGIVIDIGTILPGSSKWAHSGLMLTGNAEDQISIEGRTRGNKLSSLGDFTEEIGNTVLTINGPEGIFKISTTEKDKPLDALIETLKQLHYAALSLVAALALDVQVKSVTLKSLEIEYAKPTGQLFVQYGRHIKLADNNPQTFLTPFLPALTDHSHSSLDKIVTFLRQSYPICELTFRLQQTKPDLNLLILPHAMNQIRIHVGADIDKPYLDISLKILRRKKVVHYVTAGQVIQENILIAKYFRETVTPGVVPLVSGCAVDVDAVHAIETMLNALANL